MDKKIFSRRDFFRLTGGIGVATVLGKLLKFLPEVDPAFAKGDTPHSVSLPHPPPDLKLRPVQGANASRIVFDALSSAEAAALQKALPLFEPVPDEAKVTYAEWAKGSQKATIVSVHFMGPRGEEAILQQVIANSISETIMVTISSDLDIGTAKAYVVYEGSKIEIINLSDIGQVGVQAQSSSSCNRDAMISCLRAWGCSGWTLTSCIVALLSCPGHYGVVWQPGHVAYTVVVLGLNAGVGCVVASGIWQRLHYARGKYFHRKKVGGTTWQW